MSIDAAILPLIEHIYAAAAREISLDEAFLTFADLMGDYVAAMFVHDPILGGSTMEATVGVEKRWLLDYNQRWGASNPLLLRGLADIMAGRIVTNDALIPWEELVDTDYHREFLGPVGCRYTLAALVSGKVQRYASLVTARRESAGPYGERHFRIVDLTRPHLARALYLLEFFEGQSLSIQLFKESMNRLPFSVLLVDDAGIIVYANARAQQRLADGDGIAETAGVLHAVGQSRAAFEGEWRALAADPLSAEGRFLIHSSRHEDPVRIDATRLTVTGAAPLTTRLWMLRLSDQIIEREALSAQWRATFGFSKAECRTGMALIEHGDAISAAEALSRSEFTVRDHLKRMFAKTSTGTQAALVLKLAMQASLR